jgi:dTDP-L-rhamnose 4-epimerase
MKIVVAGGAGFIGTRLIKFLCQQRHDVICIDTFSSAIHGETPKSLLEKLCVIKTRPYGDIDYYRDDYLSADAIFLLAAETGMGSSQFNNTLYCQTNILETARLIDLLRKESSTAHVLLPSSCRIYGEGRYSCKYHGSFYPGARPLSKLQNGEWLVNCPKCNTECSFESNSHHHHVAATSTYAITKYTQEALLLNSSKTSSYDATILRLQNVYGDGQSFHNAYTGLISVFAQRILNKNFVEIYEEGCTSRDFIYVDDVCAALISAMTNRELSKNKIYDVGSGVPTNISVLAHKLIELSGMSIPVKCSRRFRIGDILNGCADISSIRDDLNWIPVVDLEQGLNHYWSWIIDQGFIPDLSISADKSLEENNILCNSNETEL